MNDRKKRQLDSDGRRLTQHAKTIAAIRDVLNNLNAPQDVMFALDEALSVAHTNYIKDATRYLDRVNARRIKQVRQVTAKAKLAIVST
ncbi:MAG: hypothetical protein V4510_11480 [bacterium]